MTANEPAAPHRLTRNLLDSWPSPGWQDVKILIGVSGGADSVALLRCLRAVTPQPENLLVAHLNHGWRGSASDGDAEFVVDLCRQLEVPCFVAHADEMLASETAANGIQADDELDPKRSEETARRLRYEFFVDIAYDQGARYVVTAHTADDRVETLLHNLFRGTGLAGISQPASFRNLHEQLVLARPLLGCSRTDVIDFLATLGQDYRTDESNLDESYRRNFIRQNLLPTIRDQYGAQVDERLLSFADHAAEAQQVFEQYAAAYLTEAEKRARAALKQGSLPKLNRSMFAFPCHVQLPTPWPVVRQALVFVWLDRRWPLAAMTRRQWDTIRQMHHAAGNADSQHKRFNMPGDLVLTAARDWLLVESLGREPAE